MPLASLRQGQGQDGDVAVVFDPALPGRSSSVRASPVASVVDLLSTRGFVLCGASPRHRDQDETIDSQQLGKCPLLLPMAEIRLRCELHAYVGPIRTAATWIDDWVRYHEVQEEAVRNN